MNGNDLLSQIWEKYKLNELYDDYAEDKQNDIFKDILEGKINDNVLNSLRDGPKFNNNSIIRKIYKLINTKEDKNISIKPETKTKIKDFVSKIGFNANSQLVKSCAAAINTEWGVNGDIQYNITLGANNGQLILKNKYRDILNDIKDCVVTNNQNIVSFTKNNDGANVNAILCTNENAVAIKANNGKIDGNVANQNEFSNSLELGYNFKNSLINAYTIKIIAAIAAAVDAAQANDAAEAMIILASARAARAVADAAQDAADGGAAGAAAVADAAQDAVDAAVEAAVGGLAAVGVGAVNDACAAVVAAARNGADADGAAAAAQAVAQRGMNAAQAVGGLDAVTAASAVVGGVINAGVDKNKVVAAAVLAGRANAADDNIELDVVINAVIGDGNRNVVGFNIGGGADDAKNAAIAIINAFGTGNSPKTRAQTTLEAIKTLSDNANFADGIATADQADTIIAAAKNNLIARIRTTNSRIIMLTILKILLEKDMDKFIKVISLIQKIGFNKNSQLIKTCATEINDVWGPGEIQYDTTIEGAFGQLKLGTNYQFIVSDIKDINIMAGNIVSFTKNSEGQDSVAAKLCFAADTGLTDIKIIRGKINDTAENDNASNVANRDNFDDSLNYNTLYASIGNNLANEANLAKIIGVNAKNNLIDAGNGGAGDAGADGVDNDQKKIAYATVSNLRARIRVTNCRIIMLTMLKILGFEIDSVIKDINDGHLKQYPLYSKEYTIIKLMTGIIQDYLKESPAVIYNQFYGLILNILNNKHKPYITYMLHLLQIYFNNNNLFSVKIDNYTQAADVANPAENLKKSINPDKIITLLSPEKTVENIRFNLDLKHDCGSLTEYDHPLLKDKDVADINAVDIYYDNTKYTCDKNQLYTLIYILQLILLNTAQQINAAVPTGLNNYFSKLYQNLLLIEYVSSRNKLTFDLNNILYKYQALVNGNANNKTITQNKQKQNYKYIQQGDHLFIIQNNDPKQISQNHMSNILSDIYKLIIDNKYRQIYNILTNTDISQILYTRSKTDINTKLRILYYYIITAGYMYNIYTDNKFTTLTTNPAFTNIKNDNKEEYILTSVLYKRDKYIGKTKIKVSIFDYIKRETLLNLKAADSNNRNELTILNSQNISENYVECLQKLISNEEVDINCFTKSEQLSKTESDENIGLSEYLRNVSKRLNTNNQQSITSTHQNIINPPIGYPTGLFYGGDFNNVANIIKNDKLYDKDIETIKIEEIEDINKIKQNMKDGIPRKDKINILREKLLSFVLQNKMNNDNMSSEFKEFLQYLTIICNDSDITQNIQELFIHIVQPDDFINIINYLNIAYIADYKGKKATSVRLVDYRIWFVANKDNLKAFYINNNIKLTTTDDNSKKDKYTDKVLIYLCIFVNELIKYCNNHKVGILTQYFNEGYHKFDNVLEVQEQKRMKQAIKNALREISDENKRNLSMIPVVHKTIHKDEYHTENKQKEQYNNTTLFKTFSDLRSNTVNLNNKHLLNQAKYVGGDIITKTDSNVKSYRYIQKYIENTLKLKGYKLNKKDSDFINGLINQYENIENEIATILIDELKGVHNTPYKKDRKEENIDYNQIINNIKKQSKGDSETKLITLNNAKKEIMDELEKTLTKLVNQYMSKEQRQNMMKILNKLS